MRKYFLWVLVFQLAFGVLGLVAQTGGPSAFEVVEFRGVLKDLSGQPLTGLFGITFTLYQQEFGGVALWLETQNVEVDQDGRYKVLLGSQTIGGIPQDLFQSGQARWVGVQVEIEAERPRVRLGSAPYALKAADADTLGGMSASEFVLKKDAGGDGGGSAGGGGLPLITSVTAGSGLTGGGDSGDLVLALDLVFTDGRYANVAGDVFLGDVTVPNLFSENVTAGGVVSGGSVIAGTGSFSNGATFSGPIDPFSVTDQTIIADEVVSRGPNRGVVGWNTTPAGGYIGVLGISEGTEGWGVAGTALAVSGKTTGVRGRSASPDGTGVLGFANASTGNTIGVRGHVLSSEGVGVLGQANATSGAAIGVHGISRGEFGRGVVGEATQPNGVGVQGSVNTSTGRAFGVLGITTSNSGTAVRGESGATSGETTAIHGIGNSPQGVVGRFDANGGGTILLGTVVGAHRFSVDSNGNVDALGTVHAAKFAGDGSMLTNLPATSFNFDVATQTELDAESSARQQADALLQVGLDGAAKLAGGNIFLGDLTAPNLFAGNNLTAGGTVSGASLVGGTGSFTGPLTGTTGTFSGSLVNPVFSVTQSGSGAAVKGENTQLTGRTFGVQGIAASIGGRGVYGLVTGRTSAIGVLGEASATTGGSIGVRGTTASSSGSAGVEGVATAKTGGTFGMRGFSDSEHGTGVQGWVTSATGFTVGVNGFNPSSNGTGVHGQSTAFSGATTGVLGSVQSPAGIAGDFVNVGGGKILSGRNRSSEVFSVGGGGNVAASGTVVALAFVGDGSGLINIGSAATASDLNCTGCVAAGEVEFNFAASTTKGGAAANADTLDGLDSTAFASALALAVETTARSAADTALSTELAGKASLAANSFTGDQGITGNETVSGTVTATKFVGDGSMLTNLPIPSGTGSSSAINPMKVALLRWYEANQAGLNFPVGRTPQGVAFDGANIWVANADSNNVTKLRTSDGAVLGTFPVGTSPRGVAFDGAHVWVTNAGSNNVTKLRASDGAVLGTFSVGASIALAFDGTNIWAANANNATVTKLRASDGAVLGTFPVGAFPVGVAFDGTNIWVTNHNSDNVTKLRASDGAVLGTFPVGAIPVGVAFDGANIWVTNFKSRNVTKLRASDGAVLETFPVVGSPISVAFDGVSIWVVNVGSNTVSKL